MIGQSETDREARRIALQQAIANDPGANADVIVEDATKFHAFLTDRTDKPTTSNEGTE